MAKGKTTAVLGPDNNKRLAALENGVSALANSLIFLGFQIGEDPISTACEKLNDQSSKIAKLEEIEAAFDASTNKLIAGLKAAGIDVGEGADLDALILDAIAKGPDNASDGEVAAIARAEAAETELGAVRLELAGAQEDLDAANSKANGLIARIADLESGRVVPSLTPAGAVLEPLEAPIAAPRERPELARDLGPTFGKIDVADFDELVESGAELELVFSNGEYELVELAPVTIKASDLSILGGRRHVNAPILIRGGAHREELHGVALLYQGEQIHYCQFPEPIGLEPGQERQFVKAITFG